MLINQFKATAKVSWYMKRAKVMSFPEVLHRLEEQCAFQVLRLQYFLRRLSKTNDPAGPSEGFTFCTHQCSQLPELSWDMEKLQPVQPLLLDGQVPVFDTSWMESPMDMSWDQAPDTKGQWPRKFFRSIAFRPGNPIGDIRVSWEPARLQHLVALGLIARHSADHIQERALSVIETHLLSWMKWNPFLQGIHYISVMECGLRILAICHSLDLIRKLLSVSHPIWDTVLRLVRDHASLIARRTSQYSSRGNHTVAEACGLVYAGLLFPEMRHASDWYSLGITLLEEEATRQLLVDGGSVEQSMWYHAFVVDLYGLTLCLLDHHGRRVSEFVYDLYSRAQHFLTTFEQTGGKRPHIGDSDGGYALSPYLCLRTRSSATTLCLEPATTTFKTSGYTRMIGRDHCETYSMVFDHGPLGMGPCYGHGHADALALILQVGKHELLIDPGTYGYGVQSEWRQYFRGTSAHNTVTVDDIDQATQETAFLWSNPYECSIVRYETTSEGHFRILARHLGYFERKSITHWRGVLFRQTGEWQIWDYLEGSGTHELALHWHVGVDPIPHGSCYVLNSGCHTLWLQVYGGDTTTHRGEIQPIRGWRSPSYGVKEPSTTIRNVYHGAVPYEFVTTLSFIEPLMADEAESSIFRRWVHEHKTC